MAKTAKVSSPTKERVLDAAQHLMVSQGYEATLADEICEKAQLTKGRFFHCFRNKEHLGREVLKRFCASGAALHESLCGDEKDPLKRVYKYVDGAAKRILDQATPNSCLLGTFAQEMSETSATIRKTREAVFYASMDTG
jgi:TetR/AcrR family transcriptional regulator, transcriptional repressor for nem operon